MVGMRLAGPDCWDRLGTVRHAVLATANAERGVDAVPVVFAVVGGALVVPVDRVKPKTTTRLQRLANIELDDRCVLLVDHYDDDWSQLWWVRVHGRARVMDPDEASLAALADRYPQYRAPESIETTIVVMPTVVLGWSATE
jgi:PPOX class probable F420-dependent enzyme